MDAPIADDASTETCDRIDSLLEASGPAAALDALIARLEEQGPPRFLLDALLLKARCDLGLPPVPAGPLSELPEPVRTKYEDRYVEAIRHVGGKLLAEGAIPEAWPYFRAIGEREPIVAALDSTPIAEGDPRVSAWIEVAFNQGAHPRRGFELILDHYGVCSAITAFEHLPADESVRRACAERLVRRLHEQLAFSLRADLERRGLPVPPEGTSIATIVAEHPELYDDDGYHTDISHLGATVRASFLLTEAETQRLALDLTEYGRRLSERHRYDGDPPFERLHEDHGAYLAALLGQDVDAALDRFRSKVGPPDPDGDPSETAPAQVLVRLLEQLGRLDEALEVACAHLGRVPEGQLVCSSPTQLCQKLGRFDRLAELARSQGEPVPYLAARLQTRGQG